MDVEAGNVLGCDGNEDVCGACTEVGDLICCERCPAAYHAECAGYGTVTHLQMAKAAISVPKTSLCLQPAPRKCLLATGSAGRAACS